MKSETSNADQLVALYLALQPIPSSLVDSTASWQHEIITQLLQNPHLDTYPPAPEYQRRTWKSIVAALEENDVEVDDAIYSYLVRLMSIPPRTGPPAASYLTYLLPCPDLRDPATAVPPEVWRRPPGVDTFSRDRRPITILASRTTIERGTTGLHPWRASLDLAEWIFKNSHLVCSGRVLELGSGVGLLGLTVATLQQLSRVSLQADDARDHPTVRASCIFMTDVDDDVLARCAANLRLPCS
ncbi:hypothetical protein FRC08_010067 [Ceratobasidium sp. 394]|nr:hypothetical protein FRC08_010067 [Ceratobasidium sp. 394]